MGDFLDILAKDAKRSVDAGYYDVSEEKLDSHHSLRESIFKCESNAIVAEIKFASPSVGTFATSLPLGIIARKMVEGGAVGLSVLTEPKHFGGNMRFLVETRHEVEVPILMKDIFVSFSQIDAASRVGASAVLLIQSLFKRGYCEGNLLEMIRYSHERGLEVLLEIHTDAEFVKALDTDADLIGINNRNLKTLEIDLSITKRVLEYHTTQTRKTIISESGINSPEDIKFLRSCGAQGFLVGTSVMTASDIRQKVKMLAMAR